MMMVMIRSAHLLCVEGVFLNQVYVTYLKRKEKIKIIILLHKTFEIFRIQKSLWMKSE